MKRLGGLMLATVMVLSMSVPTYAVNSVNVDEGETLCAISSSLGEDFQNEEGCSTELICVEADGNIYQANEYMNGNARGTNPPEAFYNIAVSGIYKGAFNTLRNKTMYTSKCFDTQDGMYYSRVRCYGEYPNLKFKCGNYCVTCEKTLSTSDEFQTPDSSMEYGAWHSLRHTVSSSHADHLVCPFVINTSGTINDQLYYISGEIWVNYTDRWS